MINQVQLGDPQLLTLTPVLARFFQPGDVHLHAPVPSSAPRGSHRCQAIRRVTSLGFSSMDRELVVQGVGEVRAMPDLASVRVGVDGEVPSREEAYQAASTTAAAADGVMADFDAAIGRVTTSALAVQPKTRWRKGESQRTGWQAFRVSVVEITDTSRVGELLNALAGA